MGAECFVAGTLIMTPSGERSIEQLAIGDAVSTVSGTRRVIWIGRRRLDLRSHPRPDQVQPVRIAAGAFGEDLPRRDLFLSPGHGVAQAGALIPVGLLANGETVTRMDWASVDYFHVEFEQHDVVFAEGLPAESYVDCGNRGEFEAQDGPMALHPLFAYASHEAACLPFVVAGPVFDSVKARLDRRIAAVGEGASTSWRSRLLGRR